MHWGSELLQVAEIASAFTKAVRLSAAGISKKGAAFLSCPLFLKCSVLLECCGQA